ncbi:MAG: hypothetical protein LBM60_07595 [Clostridium sp.]|nr:hypothetical protein [Clostridium sp.]
MKPNISTHGIKYVYATKYRSIALLFLSRWNDFLMTLETNIVDDQCQITLTERYQNALKEIYENKSGVIYTLDSKNFKQMKDMWELEYVSDQDEIPISFEVVNNILNEINSISRKGEIEIFHYPNRPTTIPKDDSDLVNKCAELYQLSQDKYNAIYCINRFPDLKEKIVQVFKDDFGIDLFESDVFHG